MASFRLSAWSSTPLQLEPEQARQIAASGLADVEIEDPPRSWRVRTDSRVGIVTGADWELRVSPRIPVSSLMFLLGYAAEFGWEDVPVAVGEERDFFAAVANGFAYHARAAVEPAPLRGYLAVEEDAQALRGRLRVADQISRSAGLPLPLRIVHDDYLPDIPENRLLKTAAELLLRLPRVPRPTASSLRRIGLSLESVSSVPVPFLAEPPAITRHNEHYKAALALATLILRGASITSGGGAVSSIGFVFDMNKVFEDFLSAALVEALERVGGRVRLQYREEFLDEQRTLRLKPDITWWEGGECRGVVDAKFKQLKDGPFPHGDAYQMLAYCTAFGLADGFLVYAHDEKEKPRSHTVRGAGVRIEVRTVDVAQPPAGLLASVERLAAEIATTAAARQARRTAAVGGRRPSRDALSA